MTLIKFKFIRVLRVKTRENLTYKDLLKSIKIKNRNKLIQVKLIFIQIAQGYFKKLYRYSILRKREKLIVTKFSELQF